MYLNNKSDRALNTSDSMRIWWNISYNSTWISFALQTLSSSLLSSIQNLILRIPLYLLRYTVLPSTKRQWRSQRWSCPILFYTAFAMFCCFCCAIHCIQLIKVEQQNAIGCFGEYDGVHFIDKETRQCNFSWIKNIFY